MFEVKRSDGLKVKIYDVEYQLKKPTVKMIELYSIDIDKVSTGEKFGRMKTLLKGMGLGVEVVDDLEFDHMNELIEFLMGAMTSVAKKN